ncbi:MAG: hypothetical protein U9P80_01770 [Thermodesulfobacteriota bacterium]|nr:hypothetical protein [Thermodesulfobacteriota bacterium]
MNGGFKIKPGGFDKERAYLEEIKRIFFTQRREDRKRKQDINLS